jgi:ferredoxin
VPPDLQFQFRICAVACGLGEIGWSKMLLTPQYGPLQRVAFLFTDAEFDEYDPIYEGHICDRCKLCVRNCAGHAISMTESVKVTLAGHEVEWGKLDELACEEGIHGGADRALSPFEGDYPRQYGYGRAVEGGCGCIRACMVHLEQRNKLTKTFRNPFRKPGWKQWKIDHSKPYEIPPEVVAEYGLDRPTTRTSSDEDPFSPLND